MSGGSSGTTKDKDLEKEELQEEGDPQWPELPSVEKWDNRARELGAEPIETPLTKLSHDVAKELRDSRGSKSGPYTKQKNIFGTHRDKQWEKEGDQWVDKGEEDLPLQGVANWSDIWSIDQDIGTDYSYRSQDDNPVEPLQEFQNKLIATNQTSRITKWVKVLGKGTYGEVWQVEYSTRRQGFWTPTSPGACKVLRLEERRVQNRGIIYSVNQMLRDLRPLQYLTKVEEGIPKDERMKGKAHIVRIIDDICIPDSKTNFPFSTVLILMELCHGTLRELNCLFGDIQDPETRIPPEQNQQWMRQITSAVQYLHRYNVVHLDIKPINIMYKRRDNSTELTKDQFLRESNEIVYKLGDFGSSQSYAPGVPAETNLKVATFKYAPPEFEPIRDAKWGEGPNIATKPWDVFSLGASLCICAISDVVYFQLFTEKGLFQFVQRFASGQEVDPTLPPLMADLISKMIATDPNSRLTIDEVAAHPWLAPVSQSSTQGSPQISSPELPRISSPGSPPKLGPSTSQRLGSRSPESSSQRKRKRSDSSESE